MRKSGQSPNSQVTCTRDPGRARTSFFHFAVQKGDAGKHHILPAALCAHHMPKERCLHSTGFRIVNWQHWQYNEICEQLIIGGEKEIQRQVTGTVWDTFIYKNNAGMFEEQGYNQTLQPLIGAMSAQCQQTHNLPLTKPRWKGVLASICIIDPLSKNIQDTP